MTQPAQPVRVIYAKLTATGDYDVVAKTDNIDINAARSLAEKLLLGNVPHDATIDEEVAYLRPADDGHLLIRYTTYNWKDENRGGAFMTDVLWLNDNDFARVRNNAFAALPHSDDVYAELTTLAPITLHSLAADSETAGLAAHADARAAYMAIAPAVLLGDPVLVIERNERRRALETFTLLLPPRLRTALTFQTRAFRVPAHPPRVTLSDTMHANLQGGPWKHVLPDLSLDVPVGLATRLIDAGARPATLHVAQELYDRSAGMGTLREEVKRFVELVDFATALDAGDMTAAFRLAATGDRKEADIKLAEVFRRSQPADIHAAVMAAIDAGAPGEAMALQLMNVADGLDAGHAASLHADVARRLIAANRMPGAALGGYLIGRLAAAGNAHAVVLIAIDPRAALAMLPADLHANQIGAFLRTLAESSRNRREIAAARQVITATLDLAPSIDDQAVSAKLAMLCREAVEAVLDKATLDVRVVRDLAQLQAEDTIHATGRLGDAVPLIFSDRQIAELNDVAAAATARANQLHDEAQAALAAALLLRASPSQEPTQQAQRANAARALLAPLQLETRTRVQRVLEELNVGADALLALPGGDALLPLLGRNTEQAASTRDLLQAVRDLGDSDDAIARMAAAVLAARKAHMVLATSHQGFAPLNAALADAMKKRRTAGSSAAVQELALELLSTITDADAFAALERGALDGNGVVVRLRRLDRAIALCRAAEEETAYEQLAAAIESPETAISDKSRERLRSALGTGGIQRRFIQMITGVVERGG